MKRIRVAGVALVAASLVACVPGGGPESSVSGSTVQDGTGVSPTRSLTTTSADGVVTLGAAGIDPAAAGAPEIVPGEVLVKFKARAPRSGIANTLNKVSYKSFRAYAVVAGLRHVKLAPGVDVNEAIAAYRDDPDVEYAEPNYVVRINALPNDPGFVDQWGLHNTGQDSGVVDNDIDAPEAWDLTTGDSDIVVAVIDSGVDYTHPDLAANILSNAADCDTDGIDDDANGYVDDCHGIDTANDDADPMDDNGHGTHVAGTIGAVGNNGVGVTGVAWNVRILPCKFIGADGTGNTADAIACLDYIAAMKARGVNVIATNNSWGGGLYSEALRQAIEAQRQRGILFVVAAGNYGADHDNAAVYPCNYDSPNVICVAALTIMNILPNFSDVGAHTVHVGAPGFDILSTLPGDAYGELSGTSMAAPHVAGIAALLEASDPARDWRALKNLILTGGDMVAAMNNTISGRRVNAMGSLNCANSTLLKRLQPTNDFVPLKRIGFTLTLRMLHINCANPNGTMSVTVSPGGEVVPLLDDGIGADQAAGDGMYSATWTANSAGTHMLQFSNAETVTVEIDAQLEPGFPVRTLHLGGSFLSGPSIHTLVGNIDGDPELEIIRTALASGPLYAWNHDGTRVPGWPRTVLESTGEVLEIGGAAYPVLGNFVGGADQLEIFTPMWWPGKAAYSGSGTMLPGWPIETFSQMPGSTFDVDGDGLDEIFSEDRDDVATGWLDGLYADAVNLPGWPRISQQGAQPYQLHTPAIGDLDGDGVAEVIAVHKEFIHVYRRDGSLLPGFPLALPLQSFPAVGDVDGDGAPEIVVTSRRQDPTHLDDIHIVSNAGVVERTIAGTFENPYVGSPVLADLDGDGIAEILVQSNGGISAWRGDGSTVPGWPIAYGGDWRTSSSPVVGDIDGDGQPDVVFTTQLAGNSTTGVLRAHSRSGAPLNGFPRTMELGGGATPAIADIDNDGRNELVVSGSYWNGYRGEYDAVWVFDLGGSTHGPIEWGQFMHDERHSGTYVTGKNLPNDAYLAVQIRGSGTVTSSPAGIDCGSDCLQMYPRGTIITLTASGSGFQGWVGACTGQASTCQVTLNEYSSVVAQFGSMPLSVALAADSAPGRVTSSPAGIDCGSDCTESFAVGTVVTLTAIPDNTSTFAGWTGACNNASTTCIVPMTAARSVTARFILRPLLEIAPNQMGGSGRVTSSPAGIDCGSDCSEYYDFGQPVTLTATPDAGSTFEGWSSAVACTGTNPVCVVQMHQAHQITAMFRAITTTDITITKAGTGTGTVTSNPAGINCGSVCRATFAPSTFVTLTATPAADSVFVGWSGVCVSTDPTCTTIVSEARAVTATFDKLPARTLTVARSGTGSGTVTSSPAGINCGSDCSEQYAANTTVTLTATPQGGSLFQGWIGGCTGSATTCVVTMSVNRNVTAVFSLPPSFALSVTRGGNAGGTVTSNPAGINCGADCSESYVGGTSVALTAAPAAGAMFAGWSGACSGTSNTCTVSMTAARSVSATFNLITYSLSVAPQGNGEGTVVSTPPGINCAVGPTCSHPMNADTVVTLTVTPGTGSFFAGWGGACTGSSISCTVTMSMARSVEATFTRYVRLTVVVAGTGAGSVSAFGIACGTDCSEDLVPGASVNLTATASAGSTFDGWSGACAGQGNVCTLTLAANQSTTASFRATPSGGNNGGSNGGGGGGAFDYLLLSLVSVLLVLRKVVPLPAWKSMYRSSAG